MDVELHIYEYDVGFWCGYSERLVTLVEKAEGCNSPPCEWEVQDLEPEQEFGFGVAYGTILLTSGGTIAELCGWVPKDPEERNTTPSDPDTMPSDTTFDCSTEIADFTGYFDLEAQEPSATLFQYDPREIELDQVGAPPTIDYDPVNLSAATLNSLTQSDWCGEWVGGQ